MLILLAGIVAFGCTFGAALISLAALARTIPRGWMMRTVLAGRGRRTALLLGSVMLLVSTGLFVGMEWTLSPG